MKKLAIIGMLAVYSIALHGENAVLDSVENNISKQLLVFPHEKIYLHTDKPYYITGEKIFFRAFLLDAFSNKQAELSRYLYVELINPMDSVVNRVKIRPDSDNLFYGALPLSEELPQGSYKIRAYTRYMANQGESSFFTKYIRISDPQILSVQTETDFQFTEDGRVNTSLRFMDLRTQKIIQPQSVSLRLNQETSFTVKPDKDGWIRVRLNLPSQATARVLYAELNENRRLSKQYIRIPYPPGDFEVSFYPEGGHIIAGQLSLVAFKALDNSGSSMDIKGEVIDSKGNTVANFQTIHDGMGEFYLHPLPGERYQAVCRSGSRTLRFDLPASQMNTCALKTFVRDDKLWVSVNKYDPDAYPELYLLIHSRGLVMYAEAWDATQDPIAFDASAFPSGINHIVLLTKDSQVISERLVFLLNDDNAATIFQTQQEAYRKREQVQAGIQLTDENQRPLKGNFSISITNDKEVVADTTSGILSDILLRSELKGYIETPEYYLQKGNKEAEIAADLLMKTHGWTRYSIPDVVLGKLSRPSIPFETGQEITGTVTSGILLKKAKNFSVLLISPNTGFSDMSETDENGRYNFQNFEFPDSTRYVIQALNNKGGGRQMTTVYVDEEIFPKVYSAWMESISPEENRNPVFLDYVAKADLQYTYENGIRIINLPEVEVRGKYQDKRKYKSYFYSEPDVSFSDEEIEEYASTDIVNLLARVPGLVVTGDNIRVRTSHNLSGILPPLILIDDIPINLHGESEMDVLNTIPVQDIGQIDVIKSIAKSTIFGSNGSGGAIAIHLKKGKMGTPPPILNISQVIPLGYQLPLEFYSPKYDTRESRENSKPDFRTTIYWKPNVVTDDKGNAKLDFYTADDLSTYTVIIEGVCNNGKLIHYRKNALIRVE